MGGNYLSDKLPCNGFWIFWDKLISMPSYSQGELAWTNIPRNSVKNITVEWNGIIREEKERYHPTQKPVKLAKAILEDYLNCDGYVLDIFGGSGSTLIACEILNKKCCMMEIEPYYCDIILTRWETFTGKKAIRKEVEHES